MAIMHDHEPAPNSRPMILGDALCALNAGRHINAALELTLNRLRGPAPPDPGVELETAHMPLIDAIRVFRDQQKRTLELLTELGELV